MSILGSILRSHRYPHLGRLLESYLRCINSKRREKRGKRLHRCFEPYYYGMLS